MDLFTKKQPSVPEFHLNPIQCDALGIGIRIQCTGGPPPDTTQSGTIRLKKYIPKDSLGDLARNNESSVPALMLLDQNVSMNNSVQILLNINQCFTLYLNHEISLL